MGTRGLGGHEGLFDVFWLLIIFFVKNVQIHLKSSLPESYAKFLFLLKKFASIGYRIKSQIFFSSTCERSKYVSWKFWRPKFGVGATYG